MIYFDHSATSNPKPKETISQVVNVLENFSVNPGRAGHRLSLEGSRILFEAREEVAGFLNSESVNCISFTSGGTEGLNTALFGLLEKGDHLVSTYAEHNSVYRPLTRLRELGIESDLADCDIDGYTPVEQIRKKIKPNTKAVMVNHISNLTGIIQPLQEYISLCQEKGLTLIVDGSQSCGYYPYDLKTEEIDILVGTGHKSLLGPQGTGFLFLRDAQLLRPFKHGGTGSESDSLKQPDLAPDKFESGTQNLPGIAGLMGGIRHIKEHGLEKIIAHKKELRQHFVSELEKIDGVVLYGNHKEHEYGPVVSLNIRDRGSSEISFMLDYDFNIMTRAGLHCAPMLHRRMGTTEQGAVRFSFGMTNTHEEVEAGIRAIQKIAKK